MISPSDTQESFIQEIIDLTNQYRVEHNKQPLVVDSALTDAAQLHSEDMAKQDFFSHVGLDGSRSWHRAEAAGYESGMVGENIAAGYTTPASVVEGWIKSEGHRENLLDERFNEIGVGYFVLEDDMGEVNYTTYWTQVFGMGTIETENFQDETNLLPSETPVAESFDPYLYVASNPDLIEIYGIDSVAWQHHYDLFGQAEGRRTDGFDAVEYLASNSDLLNALNSDPQAAVEHYVHHGYSEGRSINSFEGIQYLASYDDLIGMLGYDIEAATLHFVQWGYSEGRISDGFDEALYIASNNDLIEYFGYDLEPATEHYIQHGVGENRAITSFDPGRYLNSYADLQTAFGDDLSAAVQHYIQHGYFEGRGYS